MWIDITRGMAVLKAAWTNTPAAEIAEIKPRIRPDASDDYLEQAETYFNLNRPQSAAILAGDVLEETLRKLCRANHVPLVSQLTDIWEKATCGQWSDFSKNDVQNMLGQVRAFVTDHAPKPVLQ